MSLTYRPNARVLMLALATALSLGANAQTPPPEASPLGAHGPAHRASQDGPQAGMAQRGMQQHKAEHKAERKGDRMAQRQEKRQQRQAKALASLAQSLALQPAQQPAWQRFEQAMQARLKMSARPPMSDLAAQDLPARVTQLKARKAERDAAFEQGLQATLDLHASLDARQQAVFNAHAGHWLQAGGAGHRGEGMGKRHGHHGGSHQRHQPA